jgi:hypothetical protein
MGAAYDANLTSDKDWVRLLAGDRDIDKARLSDEEIAALLVEERNKYLAAARACEIILAKSGGIVDKQVGDLRLKWGGSSQDQYSKYIQQLRIKGAGLTLQKPKSFRVLGCRNS